MDILRAVLGDEKLTYVGRLVRHVPRARRTRGSSRTGSAGWSWTARWTRRCPPLDMNRDQTAGFETAFQSFAEGLRQAAGLPAGHARPRAGRGDRTSKPFFKRAGRAADPDRRRGRPQARRVPGDDRA